MKILVINGPNINRLGVRDKSQYGKITLEGIYSLLEREFPKVNFSFFQSNFEGEIVQIIQEAETKVEGLIINPGGYAHTSVAIKDALEDCRLPKIEVHLSHLAKRENFRQILLTASSCDGYISGFKENSYISAVFLMDKILKRKGK